MLDQQFKLRSSLLFGVLLPGLMHNTSGLVPGWTGRTWLARPAVRVAQQLAVWCPEILSLADAFILPHPSILQAPTTAAPTSRPPPPGFGGPSYTPGLLDASAAAAKAGAAAATGYRPLGVLPGEARYNPLNPLNFQSFSTAPASPPSSQFSAYRPQLL